MGIWKYASCETVHLQHSEAHLQTVLRFNDTAIIAAHSSEQQKICLIFCARLHISRPKGAASRCEKFLLIRSEIAPQSKRPTHKRHKTTRLTIIPWVVRFHVEKFSRFAKQFFFYWLLNINFGVCRTCANNVKTC